MRNGRRATIEFGGRAGRAAGLACAALFAAPAARAQAGPGLFQGGAPLPHLELPTIDGGAVLDLAALAPGRKVLLLQFASW